MKVVVITEPRRCEIVERPMPAVRDNYCLVKVLSAPMCTEYQAYRDGNPAGTLGHEAAGVVIEVARPGKVAVGDRVVVMPQDPCGVCRLCLAGDGIHCAFPRDPLAICGCSTGRATFAEYVIQQDWMLLPIPDDISTDHASMACCGLGPSFNAAQMMDVATTDTVLISGLGPVGLGAVINARVRGAKVIGMESNPWRAALAGELGAFAVIDPGDETAVEQVRALTGGLGADKSIEASSASDAPGTLVEATRVKGEITTIGWGGPIMARDITARGLTVRGAWHWNHLRYGPEMFETIRLAEPLLQKFITHRFPLDRVQEAWEQQLTGETGKIVLHPNLGEG